MISNHGIEMLIFCPLFTDIVA